jgi:formate dehydrogenase major subunit
MSFVPEVDYGTPKSIATSTVTLTIDGTAVAVPEGTSIMRAAMEAGTEIPKLCATDMLEAFGSCRLCLIEIEGRNGTPASCTTPVAAGLVVRTQRALDRIHKASWSLRLRPSVDSLDRDKHKYSGCSRPPEVGLTGSYGTDGGATRCRHRRVSPYFV